jgi:aspartate/methionine/tyrosine aminotransferase
VSSSGFERFEYLHFAKQWGAPRFNLALSGVAEVGVEAVAPQGALRPQVEGSALGPALALWRARLAARYGVPQDHVIQAHGSSGGVFLPLAALDTMLPRGAAVAVERPAYGVFESGARFLGREVVHVERPAERRFALDLDAVDAAFARGARVYCLTDLHNPSHVALSDADLAGLREIARRRDGWILLDEVYRDFRDGPAATGYRAGERVIVTSSLTKCYGLGGLRAGWIFAPPEVVARADEIEEILFGVAPSPTIALAAQALLHADELLARGRAFAAAGRPVMDAWIASTPHVSWTPPDAGLSGLVRVEGVTDSMRFAARLREELDAFVGAEGTIRVSFGLEPKLLQAALDVLAMGIPALRS